MHTKNLTLGLLINLSTSLAAAQEFTPTDASNLRQIKEAYLSPDNHTLLSVVIEKESDADKIYNVAKIYQISTADTNPNLTPLYTSKMAILPKWSPDGKKLAFIADYNGIQQLFISTPQHPKPFPLTTTPQNIQTYQWSPDSQAIAFVMPEEIPNLPKSKADVIIYNQKSLVNRLWLIKLDTPTTITPLTPIDFCVRGRGEFGTNNEEFDWSPDGKQITFAHSPSIDFESFDLHSSIATLDILSGQILPWEKHSQHESIPRYSPDGQTIAYLVGDTPTTYGFYRQAAIRSNQGQHPRLLAKTFNDGPFLAGPCLLGWNSQGDKVLFYEPKGTLYSLYWLPTDGSAPQQIDTKNHFFVSPSLSQDKQTIAYVGQSPETPPEAYISNINTFTPRRITNLNSPFVNRLKCHTEVINWESTDSTPIEGLITYPPNFSKDHPYPLLVIVHGGPMGFAYQSYNGAPYPYPYASFAESGFVVLRPNPRGSTGYGKAFRSANQGDWGGGDYQDILAGIDYLISEGIADADKLGVMGWSYGGYMTAWMIGQSPRFKAASVGAAPCNLVSMAGTMDLHHFIKSFFGSYFQNLDIYTKRSPLFYANKVTTPTLIQHGLDDLRVPVTQAYEYYHALNQEKEIATLVLYPRSGHHIMEPQLMLDAAERNLAWFKHHLLNPESTPTD